ncbi:MAG: NADP-dependent oxidoreductase [Ktedonobacteraceae bacterium]|nr:NADP-dependent oxidoreductase [Ktedonobacteraceae bacterium]
MVLEQFGSADVLHTTTVALPPVDRGQVRLRVLAAAVNPVDLGTRAGNIIQGAVYPALAAHFPMILGWDAAGVVEEIGADVLNWKIGDHVITMIHQPATQSGTYAEQIVVDAEQLAPWPGTHEPAVAAALPLAGLTALQAITALRLSPGEKVFINGPLGAVGSLAAQLAIHAGAQVVGVVRPAEREQARALGITWTVDRDSDLVRQVRDVTGGPVDAALDVVGGSVAVATLDTVRNGGRYATVIPRLEAGGPCVPIRSIIPQIIYIVPDPKGLRKLSELLGKGILSIRIGATFPLDQAAEAHRLAESHRASGKVVLIP